MCGIAGVLDLEGRPVEPRLVGLMTAALAHRGPDDEGVWVEGPVGLGHRRLSIIDLSAAAHQPMANEDGAIRITYNGEFYNYAEHLAAVRAAGHTMRSRSDTEVLIHLYEDHGLDGALERVNGMFAFGLWDGRKRTLWLARDRIGEKPLYYVVAGGRLFFASEIKALLAAGAVRPALNRRVLPEYLTYLAVPAPETLFEGVQKLAPGHCLGATPGGEVETRPYWRPLPHALAASTYAAAEAEIEALLVDTTALRLVSDVPVGLFLSGGVDSSLNLALAAEGRRSIHTFSVGYAGIGDRGELDAAAVTARTCGAEHHELIISQDDFKSFLPKLVFHQDEPIADPVCVPIHFLSQAARAAGVVVVQVGEGADELFAGYPRFRQLFEVYRRFWHPARRWPAGVRGLVSATGGALIAGTRFRKYRGLLDAFSDGGDLFWGQHVEFYDDEKAELLRPGAVPSSAVAPLVARWHAEARAAGLPDYLASMTYLELQMRLPELLLMRVDKLAMANSVEARVPFLDPRLVEAALAMPAAWKLQGGHPKAMLKRILARRLPHLDPYQPKVGFGVPLKAWFDQGIARFLREAIFDSALRREALLVESVVERMFRLTLAGRVNYHGHLWCLANLAQWYDRWVAGGVPSSSGAVAA
jgi:asparagine synthase (glutamine-hydrolysing)